MGHVILTTPDPCAGTWHSLHVFKIWPFKL